MGDCNGVDGGRSSDDMERNLEEKEGDLGQVVVKNQGEGSAKWMVMELGRLYWMRARGKRWTSLVE